MKIQHPTYLFEKGFFWLGLRIGRHPVRVIVGTLAITFLMALGMIRFEEVNNVRTEYSPMNSPSKLEYAVAKMFLKQNGTMDPCYVMTHARDGGDLLRDEYRWLIYNLTKALQTEVVVEKHGRRYSFKDLCEPYCELNTAFLAFLKLYDPKNPATYSYPSIELFGTMAFIGNNVYGINLKPNSSELASFTTAVMPFYLVAAYEDTDAVIAWQHAAIELFEQPEYSALLKTGITGDNLVSYEVRRMGVETAPLLLGSIAAMILFVVGTSFRENASQSKPWEAFIGCMIPLLAMVAALGVMSAFGLRFQAIVVAALFLVLSVGVDDIFMVLRAWDRSDLSAKIEDRMAAALEDAGPSITISSLTNIMSFAIGAASDTPAVRTFCVFSAVAIAICYLYQLILLPAVVALSGHREKKGYQSVLCCSKADPQARNEWVKYFSRIHDTIVELWAYAVTTWPTRALLGVIMLIYFYVSWLGITQLNSNIAIEKMALPDSYLREFQVQFETALRDMQPISVFVLNPGDLRNPERLQRVKDLVREYEGSLNSYGAESTFFWLPQYEDFLRFYGETDEFAYTEIPAFFRSATYFYLSSFVHMNETACTENQPECISAFFFMTNFHEVVKFHEMVPTVNDWRRIAEKYSDLDVYPYSDHTPFVDQTMAIDRTVYGSVAAALICTAVICLMFIPHIPSVISAVFSVFSISWGIFGLLSLWSVDLDPLSMAALIMAIGFSVDFTAHVTFHYYKTPPGHPRLRIQTALGVIGWPMAQVGLSTIVALLPLLFKQSYLAMVFLKTIVVVVLLGMFHGLVLLPAVLTMITRYPQKSAASSAESSERSSQRSTERKESFYNSQHLIRSINKELGWLRTKTESFRKNKVVPVDVSDLENTISTGPTAFVHKIPLGRSSSNAL